MDTLDAMFVKCQQLGDDDLTVLYTRLTREVEERKDRERRGAWKNVCMAIRHYTEHFGPIRVADLDADDGSMSVMLYHGQYAFSEYGDIEVGA